MKIHIGELIDLVQTGSVKVAKELHFDSMKELVKNGLAEFILHKEYYVPTKKGRDVYEKIIESTIEVKETYEFQF